MRICHYALSAHWFLQLIMYSYSIFIPELKADTGCLNWIMNAWIRWKASLGRSGNNAPLISQPPVVKLPSENQIFVIQVFSIHSYPYIFLLLYEHVRLPYEFCVFLCQCFMVIMGHKSLSLYEEDENGGRPDIVVRRSERTTLCRRYVDIVWVLYIKKLNFLLSRRNRVSF